MALFITPGIPHGDSMSVTTPGWDGLSASPGATGRSELATVGGVCLITAEVGMELADIDIVRVRCLTAEEATIVNPISTIARPRRIAGQVVGETLERPTAATICTTVPKTGRGIQIEYRTEKAVARV